VLLCWVVLSPCWSSMKSLKVVRAIMTRKSKQPCNHAKTNRKHSLAIQVRNSVNCRLKTLMFRLQGKSIRLMSLWSHSWSTLYVMGSHLAPLSIWQVRKTLTARIVRWACRWWSDWSFRKSQKCSPSASSCWSRTHRCAHSSLCTCSLFALCRHFSRFWHLYT